MSATARRITARLRALGWSQARLATEACYSESRLCRFLGGKMERGPTVAAMERMERALARGERKGGR